MEISLHLYRMPVGIDDAPDDIVNPFYGPNHRSLIFRRTTELRQLETVFADLFEQTDIISRPHPADTTGNDFKVLEKNRKESYRFQMAINPDFGSPYSVKAEIRIR